MLQEEHLATYGVSSSIIIVTGGEKGSASHQIDYIWFPTGGAFSATCGFGASTKFSKVFHCISWYLVSTLVQQT